VDHDEARRLLHTERERLNAMLAASAESVREQQGKDAGGSDAAKDVVDREMERSELRHLYDELQEVDAAFERLEQGTYGISELSGEPIPDERLRANPTARLLVSEQERADRGVTRR
jgi:RNA polymerase-binding transcription factor DksA